MKWYLITTMPFFSPALLFDAPHSMAAGETLALRYRILVCPDLMPADQAAGAFRDWTRRASNKCVIK